MSHRMAEGKMRGKITDDILAEIAKRELPPLLHREFVNISTDLKDCDQSVRIMQWNMLAQALTVGDFINCPMSALGCESRRLRVLEEILRYVPDVVCLEEVDQFSFLQEKLAVAGYLGIFYPKPDSPCLYQRDSYGPDGCAVFYNTKLFTLSKSDSVIIKNIDGENTNQVVLVCTFQTKTDDQKSFTIAVTHLKAKIGFDEFRRQQAIFMTNYLEKHHTGDRLFVCGDFNAEPSEPAYSQFAESSLDLGSMYTNLSSKQSEPSYTTWKFRPKGEVKHTIDYIWYSRAGVGVKAILEIPSETEVGEKALPSFRYPSDHLSLVCDVVLL